MNDRQDRLTRASESAIVFAHLLKDPPVRITEATKRLEATLGDVREAVREQSWAKNRRRAPHISLNRAKTILLRKHLDPIAADGLEMFSGLPGIKESLRLPRIKDAPARHLEAAERVRRVAAAHEQEFVSHRDYSPDFLEKFDLALENLRAAADLEPGVARLTYTRATQEVKDQITRLRLALYALDTRMREAYLDDHETLKNWRWQSRVPAKLGRPRKRKSSAASRPKRDASAQPEMRE